MRDIVYFDLETRHSAAEVGGWHNTAEMRLSVGVTYSTASGKYTIYSEEMVDDLIRQLSQADLVVGYNHEHFDYGVLQRYTMWNMIDITNNLDLCKDIEQRGECASSWIPWRPPPSVLQNGRGHPGSQMVGGIRADG